MGLADRPFRRRSDRPDRQRFVDALQEFINVQTWADSRRILEQRPELLSEEADALLERVAEAQEDPQARQAVEEHRALLRRCREVGVPAAFGEISSGTEQRMSDALLEFINVRTRADSRRILEEHPELLSDEADALLEFVAEAPYDPRARQALEEHRTVLRRCREVGIDAAFGEIAPRRGGREGVAGGESVSAPAAFEADLRREKEAMKRYLQSTDMTALDEAVAAWDRILRHPDFADSEPGFCLAALSNTGIAYLRRYAAKGQIEDLNRSLELLQQAVEQTPLGSPDLPAHLNNLGTGLRERYALVGELGDLERAIQAFEQAVEGTPEGSAHRAAMLSNLGLGLRVRYEWTSERADLEQAIQAFEQAVEGTPDDSPDLPGRLDNLGTGLRERYALVGELGDLERAIEAYEQAVEGTPEGSPDLPGHLDNLGLGLRDRYARVGELGDLERAIEAFEQAVEGTPEGSPYRATRLSNLGTGLRERYGRVGELGDLERAIEAFEQAVEGTPEGSPYRVAVLNNLGIGLRNRYARVGELGDLERAIQVYEQAIEGTPEGSPQRATVLNNLGLGLRDRYARVGEPGDLERAIEAFEQAAEGTPEGSPDLPGRLSNLGTGLSERYALVAEQGDLERAIEAYEQAVEGTPEGSPDLPGRLDNLGIGLRNRYARVGELGDLERAIEAFEQAVEGTPEGSPHRAAMLSNLGIVMSERYGRVGELGDLERAIQVYEQAVEGTPEGSPQRAAVLNNLGTGLRERYGRVGKLGDLERAIQAYEQAVKGTPEGSPDLPGRLNNLGTGLRDRYALAGEPGDLDAAISKWEGAWSLLQTSFIAAPVAYKLGQQRQWASLYARLVAAYLQLAEARPSGAPAARRRAMEIAEGSKSRLLTELLGRGDLPAPPTIPREQAVRERELMDALTTLDTAELEMHGRPVTPQEEAGRLERLQQRKQHRKELERLWKKMAQSGPEAADYVALRRGEPLDWDDLASLAADLGPESALLSLFTTSDRTLLFVMRQGWEQPAVVEADVDGDEWVDILRRFRRQVHFYDGTGRRGETWVQPIRPLIEKAAAHLAGVERIIFAPEALGHLIPWSVVGWRTGLRGPDGRPPPLVTLPALGMLPRLRRRPTGRGRGALVAGNPLGDLEHAEQEAKDVANILGTRPLIRREATKEAVLERLSDASVVHLATHAYFAPGSPLDSGIVLKDGVLTAREVMSHLLQADLLVLSACRTGMAEALGGDELAGLTQAFLQAGARSLVVSLWSVDDPATAALMTAFHAAARKAGADKATALSQAMADVRKEWPHPYYWGAFVLMGDWA